MFDFLALVRNQFGDQPEVCIVMAEDCADSKALWEAMPVAKTVLSGGHIIWNWIRMH